MKKTTNAKGMNEQYRDCPTQTHEFEIEGRMYIVVSHFTGKKGLDDVVYKNAYDRAMNEVLLAS